MDRSSLAKALSSRTALAVGAFALLAVVVIAWEMRRDREIAELRTANLPAGDYNPYATSTPAPAPAAPALPPPPIIVHQDPPPVDYLGQANQEQRVRSAEAAARSAQLQADEATARVQELEQQRSYDEMTRR